MSKNNFYRDCLYKAIDPAGREAEEGALQISVIQEILTMYLLTTTVSQLMWSH